MLLIKNEFRKTYNLPIYIIDTKKRTFTIQQKIKNIPIIIEISDDTNIERYYYFNENSLQFQEKNIQKKDTGLSFLFIFIYIS